jgi:hypothetical protein
MSRRTRSVWLTAASVGNAFATSGSRRTRVVPGPNRAAYFPRTPPFMLAKSYSGRMSPVDFDLRVFDLPFAFFIKPSFVRCGLSGADDSDSLPIFSMSYHEEAIAIRYPDCDVSLFEAGMIQVGKGRGKHVLQNCRRLVKIDSVFLEITDCLPVVLSKNHAASIRSSIHQRVPRKPSRGQVQDGGCAFSAAALKFEARTAGAWGVAWGLADGGLGWICKRRF